MAPEQFAGMVDDYERSTFTKSETWADRAACELALIISPLGAKIIPDLHSARGYRVEMRAIRSPRLML